MYINIHQPTYADIYTNIHTYIHNIIQKCIHNTSGYIHTHDIMIILLYVHNVGARYDLTSEYIYDCLSIYCYFCQRADSYSSYLPARNMIVKIIFLFDK